MVKFAPDVVTLTVVACGILLILSLKLFPPENKKEAIANWIINSTLGLTASLIISAPDNYVSGIVAAGIFASISAIYYIRKWNA